MKKVIRPIVLALVTIFSIQLLTSCFGKFAFTRKVYEFHDGLVGQDMLGKFIKSLLLIPGSVVYVFSSFIDVLLLNLIEFWTGTNPLAMKEGQSEIQLITYAGRSFQMTATKGKITVTELSGVNKGKKTVLYFDNSNSISIVKNGEKVKIAEYTPVEHNFAFYQTQSVEKSN